MAVCFNNGTSFTATNASHVINFNGTSMCTVFDSNANAIRFDRQCVCAAQITPARRTGYSYAYDYCNCNFLYYWSGSEWIFQRAFQTRFINFTGGSISAGCFRACYNHTYPAANWRRNYFCLSNCFYAYSCMLIPTCCGVTCINLNRLPSEEYVNTSSICPYSFYLGANTYSCTYTYNTAIPAGWCVRKAYMLGPNCKVRAGINFYDCRSRLYTIIGVNLGIRVSSACMNSCISHTCNFVPTTCLRSAEIPETCFYDSVWFCTNFYCPMYAAYCNAVSYASSCYRVGTVCGYTNQYNFCTCAIGNSWQSKTMGSWQGACI